MSNILSEVANIAVPVISSTCLARSTVSAGTSAAGYQTVMPCMMDAGVLGMVRMTIFVKNFSWISSTLFPAIMDRSTPVNHYIDQQSEIIYLALKHELDRKR